MLRGVLLSIDSLRSKFLLLTSRSFEVVIPFLIEELRAWIDSQCCQKWLFGGLIGDLAQGLP
jgi:hypothetical protein